MKRSIVECYAGGRYPERPRAFHWGEKRLVVEDIEQQWRAPGRLSFVVRTPNGDRFILTYDESSDVWEVDLHP